MIEEKELLYKLNYIEIENEKLRKYILYQSNKLTESNLKVIDLEKQIKELESVLSNYIKINDNVLF